MRNNLLLAVLSSGAMTLAAGAARADDVARADAAARGDDASAADDAGARVPALPQLADPESDNGGSCPVYDCTAELVPLATGGYVVTGAASFDAGGPNRECPTPAFWVVSKDGETLQKIAASWETDTYTCCCPDRRRGAFAGILGFGLEPGERISVALGSQKVCRVNLTAPVRPDPPVPCQALAAGPAPGLARVTDSALAAARPAATEAWRAGR